MNYIVCTYGGSGSWMLINYLKNFGTTYHIHDRDLPKYLTRPNPENEQFSSVAVDPSKYKVIFIYRDPVKAIFSRFNSKYHLINIKSKITLI